MSIPRPLRSHQQRLAGIVEAIATGQTEARDILAAVTPGGGKSLLPVIAATRLVESRLVERVVWVVPRDTLRLQAEEAFTDPAWRTALGHGLSLRAADNGPDPARGLDGYVTTYQAIAAAPDLHLAEIRNRRTLLVIDEAHHLPAVAETDPAAAQTDPDPESTWSRAIQPLLECAAIRLLLSGTLERADGRRILWLPYRSGEKTGTSEIELDAPGWAVIGYSRAQALQERAVLPVTFGALDGEATWEAEQGVAVGPHRLSAAFPNETTRPALFTALRTGFAEALLREAFLSVRRLRAQRRRDRELPPAATAPGLGKLLVVAPDQDSARRYLEVIRQWIPPSLARSVAQLATSDTPRAHETVARFRLRSEPSILVTVAMAYEGLDVPEIAVVAALTHIRSRPWLEQMVARATRVDPNAGAYEHQRALVFHPDDPLFQRFRIRMETEQGTVARKPKAGQAHLPLPLWLQDVLPPRDAIVPLQSNALALRYATLRPGPDLAMRRTDAPGSQSELLEAPSVTERRLRARLGELVAGQAVEDESGRAGLRNASAGPGLYHRYNAVLKRVSGDKSRAQMTVAELESAIAWLDRNRLADHLHLLDADPRYAWSARKRGEWKPPVSRGPALRP